MSERNTPGGIWEMQARIRDLEAALKLAQTAWKQAEAERDEAVELLRELYGYPGHEDSYEKAKAFLARIGSKP